MNARKLYLLLAGLSFVGLSLVVTWGLVGVRSARAQGQEVFLPFVMGPGLTSAREVEAVGAQACGARVNNTFKKLLECVSAAGASGHLAALQAIADANGGTRVGGLAGYDASAAYAVGVLEAAGYIVTTQEFEYQTFISLAPPALEQVSPAPIGPIANAIFEYSGSGDVTANVSMPLAAPLPLGCNAADFAGFPAGDIALIRRGSCTFATKAANAYAAGAVGVVIYNNTVGSINGTLGADFTLDLPVTSVTQAIGEALAATPGLVLHLKTATFRGVATTRNVLAETRGGNSNNVVMVGAHLDSVETGPGINDNGSGVAAVLETAVQMAKVKPVNKVRFALWGAEEAGLVGSIFYVDSLNDAEKRKIALYLNFDMIASPNYVYFVYDGDDSDAAGEGPGPAGSAQIEKTFERYYASIGQPFKGTDFDGRSDYFAFIEAGIPAGGLFTGAEQSKSAAEAAAWGGTVGQAFDPCYHAACDTLANVNQTALEVNVDGVAYATLQYAMNTADVNGVRGKGNFKVPAAPEDEALQ